MLSLVPQLMYRIAHRIPCRPPSSGTSFAARCLACRRRQARRSSVEVGTHMTTPSADSGSGSVPSITFDLDRPQTYGTSADEFRIWVDVIYDWFGATLPRT